MDGDIRATASLLPEITNGRNEIRTTGAGKRLRFLALYNNLQKYFFGFYCCSFNAMMYKCIVFEA